MVKHISENEFNSVINKELVLVDFYADWCGPCRMISPIVEELANEINGLKVIKVNVDNREDVAKTYGIMSIPTLILFKDGQIEKKQLGFVPKEVLLRWFN